MKKILFATASSALFGINTFAADVDCGKLFLSVKNEAAAEQSKLLQIVEARVATSPSCSCEIVKAAIEGTMADSKTVAAIVEAAIMAAPDQMRLIAQCAIAVAPDSLADIQTVLAKLDPNSGESAAVESAKDVKSGKEPVGEVASIGNPLDFPGKGPVGPLKGGPFGPIFPVFPPIIINPPDIKPPVVTDINGGPRIVTDS